MNSPSEPLCLVCGQPTGRDPGFSHCLKCVEIAAERIRQSVAKQAAQKPSRHIIQIAGSSETHDRFQSVLALCSDGTVWRIVNRPEPEDCYWARFPEIPQD